MITGDRDHIYATSQDTTLRVFSGFENCYCPEGCETAGVCATDRSMDVVSNQLRICAGGSYRIIAQ